MKRVPDGDMSMERLRELASAYGGDVARWPASERGAAETLVAQSSEARACIDQAGRLDSVLDDASEMVPSAGLLRGVAEIPIRHPRRETARAGFGAAVLWPFGRLRNVFAVAVATAAMGVLVGVVTPEVGAVASGAEAVSVAGGDSANDDLSTLDWSDEVDEELSP